MRAPPTNLLEAYHGLLRQFGPQGWWPIYRATSYQLQVPTLRSGSRHEVVGTSSRVRIRPESRRSGRDPDTRSSGLVEGRPGGALQRCPCPERLTEADRFQICVGAILTQNTAWTNVERALSALARAAASYQLQAASEFTSTFSPPLAEGERAPAEALAKAGEGVRFTTPWSPKWFASLPRSKLASLIRPTGYFNQKAKKLQIFSHWLLKQYDGSLARFFRQPTAQCRMELLSLWGIGPETADSMLLYAGRHPVFVIDAYTRRWFVEVAEAKRRPPRTYDGCQRFFMDRLPHDAQLFNEFHALIVAWGKRQRDTGTQQSVIARRESQRVTWQSR